MPEEFELPETPETPESRKERTVGLIIAVIAVVLAIVTHVGNEIHQDEILAHVDASDQYAFYQAKKDRRAQLELRLDDLQLRAGTFTADAQALAAKFGDTYAAEVKHLDADGMEIKAKADDLLAESRHLARKASILDIGEIALQISVVLCSITILTEQSLFVRLGLGVAAGGVAISAWALLLMH
ncbi:MAG TPA: DUF4337 domain-containing protein [Candidatus Methylacidiphilales bacterium]